MNELPLLIFTLCLQGSVGITLWLALGPKPGLSIQTRQLVFPVMATSFILACIGLVASSLHMGYPLNALNALRHVQSSWLSREIVFASLYLAMLGFSSLLIFLRKSGWKAFLLTAALLGLVDVFCMGQIYIHTSVITWLHINTLVMFFGSVGIIGSVVLANVYVRNSLFKAKTAMRIAGAVVIVVVLLRLIMQPVWVADITAADASIVTLPHDPLAMLAQLRHVHLFSWCMSVFGMICFGIGTFRNARGMMLAGSVIVIIAEIMLRFVFFSIG